MDKKTTKTILYTLIFIPALIVSSEILLLLITKFFNIRLPNQSNDNLIKHDRSLDFITGATKFTYSKKDIQNENSYINRHGLIRTIYSSKSNGSENIKGVAVLGNSVAVAALDGACPRPRPAHPIPCRAP